MKKNGRCEDKTQTKPRHFSVSSTLVVSKMTSKKMPTLHSAIRNLDARLDCQIFFNFFIRTADKHKKVIWKQNGAAVCEFRRRLGEEAWPLLKKAGRHGLDLELYVETMDGRPFEPEPDPRNFLDWVKPTDSALVMFRIGGDGKKGIYLTYTEDVMVRGQVYEKGKNGWYHPNHLVELFETFFELFDPTIKRGKRELKILSRTLVTISRLSKRKSSMLSRLPKDIIDFVLLPMLMPPPPRKLAPSDHPLWMESRGK